MISVLYYNCNYLLWIILYILQIAVIGAYRGKTKNLKCLFTHDVTGNTTEVNASGNGTSVNCPVRLKAGKICFNRLLFTILITIEISNDYITFLHIF